MVIPKPLFPGARVALLSPSGSLPEGRLEPTLASVRALGFEPVVSESCTVRHGCFAGTDALRAADVNRAFADDAIDGVLCARGGYGAHRLMPLLDWETIAAHPKFFCGYSDITALHMAFHQRCGFVTYHTPMPSTEWYEGLDDYTLTSLKNVLFGAVQPQVKNPQGAPLQTLVGGAGEGALIGGNLSLVASTLGTPYEIDTAGKILFLEDIEEEPYRIDRMLLALKHAGKLRACAGIVLGAWTNCEAKTPERSHTLQQVLDELLPGEGVPVLAGLQCGHVLPTLSLPLGIRARIDATAQTLTLLEGTA